MFFNCDTGEEVESGSSGLHIHRADDNLFFAEGSGLHSVHMKDNELEKFCQFLEEAAASNSYLEFNSQRIIKAFFIAFEEKDDGMRNLCFIDTRLYMVYTLRTAHLPALAAYLRKQIKWNIEDTP